jgi:hypothetical protein
MEKLKRAGLVEQIGTWNVLDHIHELVAGQ